MTLNGNRVFERKFCNRKVLEVTGLTKADFVPIKEGIKIELANIKKESEREAIENESNTGK